MSIIEKSLEMRGMKRQEIVEYFISINAVSKDNINYVGEDWSVEIKPETRVTFGVISIPSTVVVFRSSEEILNKLILNFRLRFLSAGG